MGDPSKTIYGVSLGGRAPTSALGTDRFLPANRVLPDNYKTGDGSANASVPHPDGRTKFLGAPYTIHEIMKDQTHVDSDRTKPIKVTSFGLRVKKALKDLQNTNGNNPQAQKVIDDAYHQLIIAPQIKAEKEQLARQIKAEKEQLAQAEKERSETIAFLKIRVMELSSEPTPEPTPITTERSWSKFAILGIAIVGFIIILRRKA